MAQRQSPFFREPIGSEPRFVSGSTGLSLGTLSQRKEQAQMARLRGTGKDPLGRYGDGEIFDVPKYAPAVGEADREINPVYQELLDRGYAEEVAPEDDPARTRTQIAAAKAGVSGAAVLSDPVDAKLAADIDENDAYAITHTGDPSASAGDIGGGDLKPDHIKARQQDVARQDQPSPRFLGDDGKPEAVQAVEAREESGDTSQGGQSQASGQGGSGGRSRSAAASSSGGDKDKS